MEALFPGWLVGSLHPSQLSNQTSSTEDSPSQIDGVKFTYLAHNTGVYIAVCVAN